MVCSGDAQFEILEFWSTEKMMALSIFDAKPRSLLLCDILLLRTPHW